MISAEKVRNKTFEEFLTGSKAEQVAFMKSVNINELKMVGEPLLLKKFIAMNVFMEARHAAGDKSPFNLTAQFRKLLALFVPALKLGADYGADPEQTSKTGRGVRGPYFVEPTCFGGGYQPGEDQQDVASNGYRLFHVSQMGQNTWRRKFFYLGVDEKAHHIFTKRTNTSVEPISGVLGYLGGTHGQSTVHGEIVEWDQLNNPEQLRLLLAEIKKN